MKSTVLVTAIGTITATAIVRELKKTAKYYIIGADINQKNEIVTSLEVDEFYVFPPVTEGDAYVDFVLEFCQKHNVDYYYAVLDTEVVNISKNRHRFSKIGSKLCVANYEFALKCHFKNVFSEWIEKNMPQIAIKTYKTYSEITHRVFPVFVKPIEGVASIGCRKINTIDEFNAYILPKQMNSEILVQEYISGYIITVDLVRNKRTGQKIQIQRKELRRNANGCGIAVEIIDDPQLSTICNVLMEELDLNGIANAEFFYFDDTYKIIEINPRFSAGTLYSCMAGVNTVLNARCIVDNEDCIFESIMVGNHFAERYEVYQMD